MSKGYGSTTLFVPFHTAQYIQPNVYRAPEIILDILWTYSVDIWNVGCMVSGDQ
jgi:hypothetical protein